MNIEPIKETAKTAATAKVDSKAEVAAKLEQGYRYVKIPDRDMYDFEFKGLILNQNTYKPGIHLVSAEIADSLEERLAAWERYNVRLMRPTADTASLSQLQKNG